MFIVTNMYPNVRGKQPRDTDRNTRYGTHLPVLQACVTALGATPENPIELVELGMGLSSTPFFHAQANVSLITSFEREQPWLRCADCAAGSTQPHKMLLATDTDVVSMVRQFRSQRAVALVDGFTAHRPIALEAWMRAGVSFIVEHDAETFNSFDIKHRRALAEAFGYSAWQYIELNPETALFVKEPLSLPISGCVRL